MRRWLMALGFCAGTACAHHSLAQFQSGGSFELDGTIVSFLWENPHVRIVILAQRIDGRPQTPPQQWTLVAESPGQLARGGVLVYPGRIGLPDHGAWRPGALTTGEVVAVHHVQPMNGQPLVGFFRYIVLPQGGVLSVSRRLAPTNPADAAAPDVR